MTYSDANLISLQEGDLVCEKVNKSQCSIHSDCEHVVYKPEMNPGVFIVSWCMPSLMLMLERGSAA